MHLQIGAAPPKHNQTSLPSSYQSPFDRIPGTPLLSKTCQTVGSLHPDNTALTPPPGSTIELLVLTRSQTPTVGSALLQPSDTETIRPIKLFWVLYVVWEDGIAERRGVGQILESAIEDAVEPAPRVKGVFLG